MGDGTFRERVRTIGLDGQAHEYDVECARQDDRNGRQWIYRIWREDRTDCYEAQFVEFGDGLLRPTALRRGRCHHLRGVGLAEALFELAAKSARRRLVSSISGGPDLDEFRTISANRIWERLRGVGRATYDRETDRYTFIS